MANHTRNGRAELTLVNALLLAVVVAIAGGVAIPLIEKATAQAKQTSLLQNLQTLRSQIELYKLEHGGAPPVVYQNTLPQLIRATNAQGVPGPSGSNFPYGPYLHSGIPINPVTGRSIVVLTDTFPPTAPTGTGGWVYHQPTGRLAVDLEGWLDK